LGRHSCSFVATHTISLDDPPPAKETSKDEYLNSRTIKTLQKLTVMPDYPGLGLPIRHENWDIDGFPHGAEYSDATDSELLYVRELAMMDVMEKLTDKPDWNKKVFDKAIVAKWGTEALAVPDYDLYLLANEDGPDEYGQQLEGILDGNAFDCVRIHFHL
jgi:hypothetical protein